MAIIAVHVEGPVRQFRRRCVQAITVLLGGLRIPSIPPGLPVQFADLSATSPFPGDHRAARIRLVESARRPPHRSRSDLSVAAAFTGVLEDTVPSASNSPRFTRFCSGTVRLDGLSTSRTT
jgi:hypothetical protein